MEDLLIVTVVFGFVAFIVSGVFKLIRYKIDKESGTDEELLMRLAKAFKEHKNEMERRVRNLEAIAAGDEPESEYPELEEPHEEGTLSNQLERKRRTR